MDNRQVLKDKLISLNNDSLYKELICTPTKKQLERLKNGSGNPDDDMRKVNSSAGLAVNYWRAYELCHSEETTVEFEWKKRPLQYGTPANIDVVIRASDYVWFVESKFLEPYYSKNEAPNDSYEDISKYSTYTKDSPESWIALFQKTNEFEYYNVTQLCRHLLAISKDMIKGKKKYYQQKQVRLISVTWDMPDSFLSLFPKEIAEEFKNRRSIIREEAKKSEVFINDFIKKHLDFPNLEYKAIKYNDIIGEIKDSQYVERIKKQYFL